jgi:N-acetylneuraminate lyase
MTTARYNGLFAATLTPMKANGEIALDHIGPQIERLIERGVTGLYVCGSTGEGVSLTNAERKTVTIESIRAAAGRVPMLVQVGHNSLAEAAELAAHATASGAAGISATCPSYFKIGNVQVLVDSMKVIADAARDLPFYYYHIPALTGNRISMTEFLNIGGEAMPNLVGLKYTSPELHEYQQCIELDGGRFEVMWGVDEMLIAALTVGGKVAVGSTYNVASPLYRRLISAFEQGDLAKARQYQSQAIAFIGIVLGYPFQSAMKHILHWQGSPAESYCRLPQQELTLEQITSLHSRLAAIGFFDWCN